MGPAVDPPQPLFIPIGACDPPTPPLVADAGTGRVVSMSISKEVPPSTRDNLFARAQTGDQDAWRELFETCYPKIVRVIRRKLQSPSVRALYDSTDFASDVWKSLAANADRFHFPTV